MKTLVFVSLLFARTVFTLLRRLTMGPRRPAWSIPAERVPLTEGRTRPTLRTPS